MLRFQVGGMARMEERTMSAMPHNREINTQEVEGSCLRSFKGDHRWKE